jgi:hypothetical protein
MAFSQVTVVDFDGETMTLSAPSVAVRESVDTVLGGLVSALEHEFKAKVKVAWAGASTSEATPAPVTSPSEPEVSAVPVVEEVDDVYESGDDDVVATESVPDHLIAEFFPGAEELS